MTMKDSRDGRTPKYHGFKTDRSNPHRSVRCHNKIKCSKYVAESDIYVYCVSLGSKEKTSKGKGWRSYIGRHYCSCCGPPNNKKRLSPC